MQLNQNKEMYMKSKFRNDIQMKEDYYIEQHIEVDLKKTQVNSGTLPLADIKEGS